MALCLADCRHRALTATELSALLNHIINQHPDLKTDRLGIDTCRSLVAVIDSVTTSKLDFEELGNPLQCSCLENPRVGRAGGLPFMESHRVGHD